MLETIFDNQKRDSRWGTRDKKFLAIYNTIFMKRVPKFAPTDLKSDGDCPKISVRRHLWMTYEVLRHFEVARNSLNYQRLDQAP